MTDTKSNSEQCISYFLSLCNKFLSIIINTYSDTSEIRNKYSHNAGKSVVTMPVSQLDCQTISLAISSALWVGEDKHLRINLGIYKWCIIFVPAIALRVNADLPAAFTLLALIFITWLVTPSGFFFYNYGDQYHKEYDDTHSSY